MQEIIKHKEGLLFCEIFKLYRHKTSFNILIIWIF